MQEIHQPRRLPGEQQQEALGKRVERASVADGQLVAPQSREAHFLHETLHHREACLAGRLVDEVDARGHHRPMLRQERNAP